MCVNSFYSVQLLIVMGFCASSIGGLKIRNNGVMTSTQQPHAEDKIDIGTELVAPLTSSNSQYFQPPSLLEIQLLKQQQNQQNHPQTLAQLLSLQNQHQQQPQQFFHSLIHQQQQQAPINPFLYLGQLISSVDPPESNTRNPEQSPNNQQQPKNSQPKRRNDERSFQDHEKNSYVLPSEIDESAEFVDMVPPSEDQEPNYYVLKPRKFKKYFEVEAKDKKKNVRRATDSLTKEIKTTNNDKSENFDLLTQSTDEIEQSAPTSRLDFQMHGN